MTSATANGLISDALSDLGVLASGQTASAADLALGLRRLNAMIDDWRTSGLLVPLWTRTAYNLVAGTATYTIGSGGTFNQDRPERIPAAGLILDPSADSPTEYALGSSLTRYEWVGVTDKDVSGTPRAIYYNPTYTASLGVITVYPVPDSSDYDLVLYTPTPLAQFADTSTSYVLPSGYERAIVKNLALELAPAFGAVPSSEVLRGAESTMSKIKHRNAQVPMMGMDPSMPGLSGSRDFDIYSGR